MSKPAVLKERESDILRTIMDGLAAKRIWAMRCNTGGMFGVHKGKRWAVKFGRRGMADILAVSQQNDGWWSDCECCPPRCWQELIWIECKTATGKQSADQAAFQAEVEQEGHRYLLVRNWAELLEKL